MPLMRDEDTGANERPLEGPLEQGARRLAVLAVRWAFERAAQRGAGEAMPGRKRHEDDQT
jgi:hypothetical protein